MAKLKGLLRQQAMLAPCAVRELLSPGCALLVQLINGKLDCPPSFSFLVRMTFLFICCFQLSHYAQSGAMCARAVLLPHLWTEASHGFIPL